MSRVKSMEHYFEHMSELLRQVSVSRQLPTLNVIFIESTRLLLGGFVLKFLFQKRMTFNPYSMRTPVTIIGRGGLCVKGVVKSCSLTHLDIYCHKLYPFIRPEFDLRVVSREVDTTSSFERFIRAIQSGENHVRDLILGNKESNLPLEVASLEFCQLDLDKGQRESVLKLMSISDVAVLEGVAGSGKTKVLAELVWQRIKADSTTRVLCLAASNCGVDVICRRLVELGLQVVRDAPHYIVPEDMVNLTPDSLMKSSLGLSSRRSIIKGATIVCATLLQATSAKLAGVLFDLVIMDESSQIPEPMSWVRVILMKQVDRFMSQVGVCKTTGGLILCGDQKQLPPVVTHQRASPDVGLTLLGRLMMNSQIPKIKLTMQYRYPKVISEFVSEV